MKEASIPGRIWSNGGSGWGVKIPDLVVRQQHFDRGVNHGKIWVEVDGVEYLMNIDKKSFWTPKCGELIHKAVREAVERHELQTGDPVHLEVLEPFRRYRLLLDSCPSG